MKNPNPPRTTNPLALEQNHISTICERGQLTLPNRGESTPPFGGSPYLLGIAAKPAEAYCAHARVHKRKYLYPNEKTGSLGWFS